MYEDEHLDAWWEERLSATSDHELEDDGYDPFLDADEDEERDEENDYPPDCPACEGDGATAVSLGRLGSLAWYRCRYCGVDYHEPAEDAAPIAETA